MPEPQPADAPSAKRVRRKFHYKGLELADPGSHMTDDEVRLHYAQRFPELLNARVVIRDGGVVEDDRVRREEWDMIVDPAPKPPATVRVKNVEFQRASGTKG